MDPKDPGGCLIRDIQKLREMTQSEWPGIPYFMLGHSMGSYEIRRYLSEYGKGLAGAVVMGTGSVPFGVAGMGNAMAKMIGAVRGWKYRPALLEKLSTGSGPYRQFSLDGSQPENSWLTRDAEIVKKYYSDPFCGFRFTANGYLSLFDMLAFDADPDHIRSIPAELPILLVAGSEDPVGDMGSGVKSVFEQFRSAGLKHVEMKLFEGDRHEILNEVNRDEVYESLWSWIAENMP